MTAPVRAVLFDDQPYWLEFLSTGLRRAGIDVVGTATTPDGLRELVDTTAFDVAVLDVLVGPAKELTGLAIALWLRTHLPQVGLLLFTTYPSPFPAFRLLRMTPSVRVGYLLKTGIDHIEEVARAVTGVAAGQNVLDDEIRAKLLPLQGGTFPGERLTDADLAVLSRVVEGLTNEQIAARTHYSVQAVERRLARIFERLGLPSRGATERPNVRVRSVMIWVESLQLFRDAKRVEPVEWDPPRARR